MNLHKMLFGLHAGMLLALGVAGSASADQQVPYKYSDEWSVVSAPGPSGPYQPVNIDPRVPGSALPLLPDLPGAVDANLAEQDDSLAAQQPMPPTGEPDVEADTLSQPPAAGPPDRGSVASGSSPARTPYSGPQQPVPGYYRNIAPPAAFRNPVQPASPAAGWRPAYPNRPPPGYYRSPAYSSGEQEVPPPPVYEEQQRRGRYYQRPY